MKKRPLGFTLVEIMIVVAIIGMLASIAIPSFMKSRQASRTSACLNNLRQLDGAKELCAMQDNLAESAMISSIDLDSFIKGGTESVKCPSDRTKSFNTSYTIGLIGSKPLCRNVPLSHTL